MSNTHYIKRVLYTLKRKYGSLLDLYRETNETVNLETGKRVRDRMKYSVKKAILLPANLKYVIPIQDNMLHRQSDGAFNIVDREVIIAIKDLTILPMLTDYIIINHQRYEIIRITQFDHGYHLELKEWKTSVGYEIHNLRIHDNLHIGESVS